MNTGTTNIPIPNSAYARWRRVKELSYYTAKHQAEDKTFGLPTEEQERQNKEAVIMVTLLATLDYFIYDLIDEMVEAGKYRHNNKRMLTRSKDVILHAHDRFYKAISTYDNKGCKQYNEAMDLFYKSINDCIKLETPERAYNIVVAICRLQAEQDKKLKYHTYLPSREVAKIPQWLECLDIKDYHLDRIIEQSIRPIIFNQEYR